MAQLVFSRKEMKYFVPIDRFYDFKAEIDKHMKADEYGEYAACNVYYDTDVFNLIRMSLDRPMYKEKLRMRSYGVPGPDSKVFLEIKKKFDGMVYKRRETLTYTQACDFLDRGIYPVEHDSQIMRELRYFMQLHKPKPTLYLSYDRMAFKGIAEKDLRLTFDSNIRYRFENVHLHEGNYGETLLPPDMHLMEIKMSTAMPLWLTGLLDQYQIRRTSFTKYGRIYEKEFAKRGGMHLAENK